jgi:hypothetical protein
MQDPEGREGTPAGGRGRGGGRGGSPTTTRPPPATATTAPPSGNMQQQQQQFAAANGDDKYDVPPPHLSVSLLSTHHCQHPRQPGCADQMKASSTTTTTGRGGGAPARQEPRNNEHFHAGEVTEGAMRAFGEAMELIDPHIKAGYVRAQLNCPECVLVHECCPCHFLKACQLNPWDAAARMCSYWTERIDLFGDIRAFEALTLGSDVASPTGLTAEDVRIFEKGTMMVLPVDRHGQSVIFYDDSALDPDMVENTPSRLRVLWYIFQAAYTSGEAAMGHRIVLLIGCHRPSLTGGYGAAAWRFSRRCRTFPSALPIVLDSIHLLTLSSRTGNGIFVKFVLAATLEMVGSYLSALVRVHHGEAKGGTCDPRQADVEAQQCLLRQLRGLGFTKSGLPEFAGGLHTTEEDFPAWARRRRRVEQRVFWTDEQRAQQKRDVNKIHSRQKRARRTVEVEDLRAEAQQLEIANIRARTAGDRLEALVEEACNEVKRLKQDDRASDRPTWQLEQFHSPAQLPQQESPHVVEVLASLEPDPIAPHCVPSVVQQQDSIVSSSSSWFRGPVLAGQHVPLHSAGEEFQQQQQQQQQPAGASVMSSASGSYAATVLSVYSSSARLPSELPLWSAETARGVQLARLADLERHRASSSSVLRGTYDPFPNSARTVGGNPIVGLSLPDQAAAYGGGHPTTPSALFMPAAFRQRYTAGMSSITSFFQPYRGPPHSGPAAVGEANPGEHRPSSHL